MVLFLGFGWGTSPNPRFEGYGGGKTLILGYLCKDLMRFCIEGYDSWISLFLKTRVSS